MSKHRLKRRWMWVIPLVMLLAAALACGPFGGGGEEPTPEEDAGVTPEEIVEPTAEPVTVEAVEKPTAAPPTATPPPSNLITAANAASLEVLRYGTVSETVLLAASASPTARQFATFGFDKVVRIWDPDTGNLLREMTGSGDYGYGLAYSPDGSRLASTGGYHVYIWDPATGAQVHDVIVNSFAFRVVWSPDGSRLAVVGGGSSRIEIINAEKGVLLADEELQNPERRVLWAVAYAPDGSLLATGDGDGRVHVLDSASTEVVFESTTATRGATWDLEFSPDGSMLASCHSGGGVFIWNTSDWSIVLSGDDLFAGGCTDGTFSVGSDVYFAVGADGHLYGWDMSAGGDPLVDITGDVQLWMVSMSGDGEFLVVALDDGTAGVVGLR